MYLRTLHGIDVHTVSPHSDSFTLYHGDKVIAECVNGDEVEQKVTNYVLYGDVDARPDCMPVSGIVSEILS